LSVRVVGRGVCGGVGVMDWGCGIGGKKDKKWVEIGPENCVFGDAR